MYLICFSICHFRLVIIDLYTTLVFLIVKGRIETFICLHPRHLVSDGMFLIYNRTQFFFLQSIHGKSTCILYSKSTCLVHQIVYFDTYKNGDENNIRSEHITYFLCVFVKSIVSRQNKDVNQYIYDTKSLLVDHVVMTDV